MGNSQNSEVVPRLEYKDLIQEYHPVSQKNQTLGEVILYASKKNPNEHAVQRSFNTNTEEQFEFLRQQVIKRQQMHHNNICRMISYDKKSEKSFCSSSYQLKTLMEYSNYNLLQEVERRSIGQELFSERQLYLIISEVVSGLAYYYSKLQNNSNGHGNIRLDSIYMCKQNPNYQVMNDWPINDTQFFVKIQDPLVFYPESNYNLAVINMLSVSTYNYLSPILTESILRNQSDQKLDHQKQDLFTFGMCMLHCASLENCNDSYDYTAGRFFEDVMFQRLDRLAQRYSHPFCQIINKMLILRDIDRPNIFKFLEYLRSQDKFFINQPQHHHEDIKRHRNVSPTRPPMQQGMYRQPEDMGSTNNFSPVRPYQFQQTPDDPADHEVHEMTEYSDRMPYDNQQQQFMMQSGGSMRNSQNFYYQMNNSRMMYEQNVPPEVIVAQQHQQQNQMYQQQQQLQHMDNSMDMSTGFPPGQYPNPEQVNVTYPDQSRYEGQQIMGQRHGFGIFFYPFYGRYEGQWKQDKQNGKGKLYHKNQLQYDGYFMNDMYNGKGILYNTQQSPQMSEPIFQNLNNDQLWVRYEGDFAQDQKQGWGVLYFKGGFRFEGQFMQNQVNGNGTFYNPNNNIIVRGVWRNNILTQ